MPAPLAALRSATVLSALALLGLASSAGAQSLPAGFEAVALPGGFPGIVGFVFAPDGTAFLIRHDGRVHVHRGNAAQTLPFIDLQDEVNMDSDRGLLGIAVHPGFLPDDGPTSWVYLLYTVSPVPGDDLAYNENNQFSFSRLTRYRATTVNMSIVANVASREVLLGHQLPDGSVPDAIASIHNSHSNGSLIFGADGTLLVFTGDGAHHDVFDPGGIDNAGFDDFVHPITGLRGPTPKAQDFGAYRSQMLNTLAGKILRVDPETGFALDSNPFYDGDPASNASRVWALGLRNPFRGALLPGTGSSDPSLADPGTLILGDVGRATWEELDVCRGGENFGWPCFEGQAQVNDYKVYDPPGAAPAPCSLTPIGSLTAPIVVWNHSNPALYQPAGSYQTDAGSPIPGGFLGICTVGGAPYAGGAYPDEYDGRFFFSDFALGWIKTAQLDASQSVVALRPFFQSPAMVTAIGRHPLTGDIYFASNNSGKLTKIRYVDPDAVKVIGCGVNPADSLALAEPSLSIGSVVHFELDNPVGTQSAGAATVLALSVAPNAAYPCGVLVPGLGMSAPGALGELLLNPSPGAFLDPIPGPLWPGSPATITIGVPFSLALVGYTIFAQGAIVDPTFGGGGGVGIALTGALEIVIGS